MLFYTGITRSASTILKEQKDNTTSDPSKIENLHKMVELVTILREQLLRNNIDRKISAWLGYNSPTRGQASLIKGLRAASGES